MLKPGKHPADFPVLTFRQHDFEYGDVATFGHDPCSPGSNFAFRKPHAFGQLIDDFLSGIAGDRYAIGLFDPITRVREPLGQCAVVGQQHQPFAVPVEPADDKDALTGTWNEIQHERPARWIF
jgi:hypothetical protein